jgi:hypothetical protein
VSGGWAIDLYLGEVTREHEDLEISIFRHHQAALHSHFAGRGLFKAESHAWLPWDEGESLELPIHQILVRPPSDPAVPDPWHPAADELQFFLNEVEGGIWLCRRDQRVTRHVREVAIRTDSGIPICAPEIQLLYKAAHPIEKNEHDFELVAPRLIGKPRVWLHEALEVVHPGHRWLEQLV